MELKYPGWKNVFLHQNNKDNGKITALSVFFPTHKKQKGCRKNMQQP